MSISDNKYKGVALGRWIAQLRTYRKSGIQSAYLTSERIAALDGIGMVWDVPDYLWERNFAAAVEYHREHGDLNIPVDYVDRNGIRLGAWMFNIRHGLKNKNGRTQLTAEQIARLDELGMNWAGKHNATWDKAYRAAYQYKKMNGNLDIPAAYVTADGISLGRWIRRQKTAKLTEERRNKLDALGFIWEKEDPWKKKFELVKAYYAQHGNTKIPTDLVVNGVWLRRWLTEQVARLNEKPTGRNKTVKRLTAEQIAKLQSVGIVPDAKPVKTRACQEAQAEQRSSA